MLRESLFLVLSRYPSQVQPVSVVERLGSAGGSSGATLWRYRAAAGDMVVRGWPVDGPSIARLETIHGWLREAADPGLLPIPVPVPARDGRTVQHQYGRCWEIAPWLPGDPELGRPPARNRVQIALAALAALHGRLSRHREEGTSPGIRLRVRELEELASGGFDLLEAALTRPPADEHLAMGRRWLALARATVPRLLPLLRDAARLRVPLQPCLRDARPEHFLFEGDRLSGLIDFGAMGIETVAADLARLIGEWLADDRSLRAGAVAAYEQVRPLDHSEAALIAPFEAAADVLIAGHWLGWHFLEHRCFEDPLAIARGLARGLDRLERLAERGKPRGLIV